MRSGTSPSARRARVGQSLIETVVVVAIIATGISATIFSLRSTHESTIGAYAGLTTAFQAARQEARGNVGTTPNQGATLLLTTDSNGDAVAKIYDGVAGTTYTGHLVRTLSIPAQLVVKTGTVRSANNLALLFSSDGNLTYATWTPGNPLTPTDCATNLLLALNTSAGNAMGYAQATCGSQSLTLEDRQGQPIKNTPA